MDANFWAALAGIVWIDLLLSGDNAVVIALVCRQLPARQQRIGMILGAGAAIGLRVVLAFFVAALLAVPFLSSIGGAFLLYVAVKLTTAEHGPDEGGKAATTLAGAIATIAIADVGMSLDNVIAIAALSHGHWLLMALGVLISIPMVIAGSVVVSAMVERFPALTWAGAALLGWVAGGIIVADPLVQRHVAPGDEAMTHYASATAGLLSVLLVGASLRRFGRPADRAA